MSRCRHTDDLLQAAFADAGITRTQAAHASECTVCARELAAARHFEVELHRAADDIVADTELADGSRRRASAVRGGMTMRHAAVAAAIVGIVVITAAGFVGGRWIGSFVDVGFDDSAPAADEQEAGEDAERARAQAADAAARAEVARRAAEAARLIGVRPEDVLFTEDGALALDDRGVVVDLVLIRPSLDGPIAKVIGTSVPSGRGATTGVVTCTEDTELARVSYVWGRFEPIESVVGPGDHQIVDGRQIVEQRPGEVHEFDVSYLTFAYARDGEASEPVIVRGRFHDVLDFGPPGEFVERECLERDYDPMAPDIVTDRLRCSDFPGLTADEQRAVTDALVGDEMLSTIDRAQGLAPSVPREETIAAAAGSLDKWCRDPANANVLVSRVLARGYGFAD